MSLSVAAHTPSTHFRSRSSHALSVQDLEEAGQLMKFNWLVASYAHSSWLGPWAGLLEPRHEVSMRLLRRVSCALLTRHSLQDRHLRDVENLFWLLMPIETISSIAEELGIAMLGGWVRAGIEREQVAQQRQILTNIQRIAAMQHAATLKALPYTDLQGWPLSRLEPAAVTELGISCMAMLLDDEDTGSRTRFSMRFAHGMVTPLDLTTAQRIEALSLVQRCAQTNTTLGRTGGSSSVPLQVTESIEGIHP